MRIFILYICMFSILFSILDANMMEMVAAEGPISPNYCNNSEILEENGLYRSTLGQFLGYECSEEFYHCRWQSDGFRTYRKKCKPGLVYDVLGTQNCNYDYNVKSCGARSGGPVQCNGTDFYCSLSEQCVPMSARCDGHYDCAMEEDEQNCPLCTAGEFACKVSEQCIPLDRRCNGLVECDDGTDERDCDVCGHGLFHCGKSNECIPMDERCDGRRQCPHGEDEMLCKKSEGDKKFTCQSRDFEIPSNQVCDGQANCPDASDEAYCDFPGAPKSQAAISFSSNLGASTADPRILPPMPRQPEEEKVEEEEEAEEDYDYENIKNEQAPFPMISLGPFPTTQRMSQITIETTQPPPPPTMPPRTIKPAFSKPKPKINNVYEQKTTQRHRIVQPNLVKVTSTPRVASTTSAPLITKYPIRSTFETTTKQRTRQPNRTTLTSSKVSQPLVQTPRTIQTGNQSEKVFIMQVTASPPIRQSIGVKSAPEVRTQPTQSAQQSVGTDMLKEITSQINGGMSPELLAKIESIIKSEMASGPTNGMAARFRRFRPIE